jgi:hypothetical protein
MLLTFRVGERELDPDASCWIDRGGNFYQCDYKDYPSDCADVFPWNCCEKPADWSPCKLERHRPEGADDWNGWAYAVNELDSDEPTGSEPEEESEEDLDDESDISSEEESEPVSEPSSEGVSEGVSEPEFDAVVGPGSDGQMGDE